MRKFVTFEGIDGSGKSTVSKLVFKKLKKEGYKVVLTFEPTNSCIGKMVQRCIEKKSDPFVTAFTFIADRIDHCKKIKEWLDEGYIVLCDRYAESTYAYQGAQMQGFIDDPIKWLQDLSGNRVIIPDRTFVFIIDPEEALSRIQDRDNLIPFEKIDFLRKVDKNYRKFLDDRRFLKLDATKSVERLVSDCYKEIIG